MAKIKIKFGAVTNKALRGIKSMQGKLDGFFKFASAGAAGLAAGGLGLIAAGFEKIVLAGAKLEQTKVAFEVMLGSAEKANAVIKEMRGFADVTPFRTNEILAGTRALLAAKVEAKDLQSTMKMIGDISAGVQVPIGQLIKMYAKLKNQGRITFEEINQLTTSGAVSIDEMAKKVGLNKVQFRKFVEAGRFGFKEMKSMFEDLTGEGSRFGGMMERQAQTVGGKWSTFQGVVENTFADLGEGTKPLGRVIDNMTKIVRLVREWEGLFRSIANFSEGLAGITESMVTGKPLGVSGPGGFQTSTLDTVADTLSSYGYQGRPQDAGVLDMISPGNFMGGIGSIINSMGYGAEAAGERAMGQTEQTMLLQQQVEKLDSINRNLESTQLQQPGGH